MPMTNGTPMPRIAWPVYEFSTSEKSIADFTNR